jgi:2,5-diketo-D-gluconate reductase A
MQDLNRGGLTKAIGVELLSRPASRLDPAQRDHARRQPDRDPPVQPAHRRPGCHARARRADRVWGPFTEGQNNIFSNPVLSEIGAAHGKSVAQVVLRWLIQLDVVVIPKSVRPDRMRENIAVFDCALTNGNMARIAELDTGGTLFFNHDDPEWVSRLNSIRVD